MVPAGIAGRKAILPQRHRTITHKLLHDKVLSSANILSFLIGTFLEKKAVFFNKALLMNFA